MGATVLVVEDNPLNLQLVRDILEAQGHTVVSATNVGEGRDRIRASVPDIVLLDIQIPGGGGETLLREIRAQTELAGLPVIAVTAQAMGGDEQRLRQAGFDGYISKPIDVRRFPAVVASFLQLRSVR